MKKSADVQKTDKTRTRNTDVAAEGKKRTRAPRKSANGAPEIPNGLQAARSTPVTVMEVIEDVTVWQEPTVDDIARRAYEIFQSRARHEGDALGDWIQAERELRKPR